MFEIFLLVNALSYNITYLLLQIASIACDPNKPQQLPSHVPDPHTAIPADFAIPRLLVTLDRIGDEESEMIADLCEEKKGTITAHVKAMLIAASKTGSLPVSDAIVVANSAMSDEGEASRHIVASTTSCSSPPSSPLSSPQKSSPLSPPSASSSSTSSTSSSSSSSSASSSSSSSSSLSVFLPSSLTNRQLELSNGSLFMQRSEKSSSGNPFLRSSCDSISAALQNDDSSPIASTQILTVTSEIKSCSPIKFEEVPSSSERGSPVHSVSMLESLSRGAAEKLKVLILVNFTRFDHCR
jgi:hypothetical protein